MGCSQAKKVSARADTNSTSVEEVDVNTDRPAVPVLLGASPIDEHRFELWCSSVVAVAPHRQFVMPAQLTYWDGHGNAEIIRLMMAVTGEEWEDKVALDPNGATHISNANQMQALREAGLLVADQLPLLQIDGLNLVQKIAAVRYLARKHGLYGKNNAEATQCDIIQDTLQDYQGQADDYKTLPRLGRALGAGPYFLGESMNFVDVTFFQIIDDRLSQDAGALGSMPDWVKSHYARMLKNAKLDSYLKSEKRFPRPGRDGYYDRVKAALAYMSWAGGDGIMPPMACDKWNYTSGQ